MFELLNISASCSLVRFADMKIMTCIVLIVPLIAPLGVLAQTDRWVSNTCKAGAGAGTDSWANGDTYQGQCQNERIHGHGRLVRANGESYLGLWRNDRYHGQGIYCWVNGDVYQGQWRDELQSGEGTLVRGTGENYSGDWLRGRKYGEGTLTLAGGDSYRVAVRHRLRPLTCAVCEAR
jgi:hypothetical protein